MTSFQYVGNELDVFAEARNWRAYLKSRIGRKIGGEVLEVGAGIGSMTLSLCDATATRWVCLEPDAQLANRLADRLRSEPPPAPVQVVRADLEGFDSPDRFDTILYLDVLEHIEDDRGELARAAERLKPGGRLITLTPAPPWAYSPFDRRIGHFRRYDGRRLRAITPEGLQIDMLFYLDALGLLLSLANRLALRQEEPSAAQIRFWDRVVIRGSLLVDPLLGRSIGRSIVAIWHKPR